jgi:hypothetical protein
VCVCATEDFFSDQLKGIHGKNTVFV